MFVVRCFLVGARWLGGVFKGCMDRLSASLARLCTKEGFSVALAVRQIDKLSALWEVELRPWVEKF